MTVAAVDHWTPYEDQHSKGKGKGHPVTPESGVTGAVLLAICLAIVLVKRFRSHA